MTDATPSTHWLGGRLTVDAKGFIKTGPDPEGRRSMGKSWSQSLAILLPVLGLFARAALLTAQEETDVA